MLYKKVPLAKLDSTSSAIESLGSPHHLHLHRAAVEAVDEEVVVEAEALVLLRNCLDRNAPRDGHPVVNQFLGILHKLQPILMGL